MAIPRSPADYLGALLALLPRGRVWSRDPNSTMVKALSGLTPVYARNDARACELLVDAFPSTAVELLPEWESTLGLPDPCLGPAATIPQRQALVTAKLTARGGQSAQYFVDVAATIGIPITVSNFAPCRFGIAHFGDPMLGVEWAHVWAVHAQLGPVIDTDFAEGKFGDRFRTWGIPVLECQLREIEPAHAKLIFLYNLPTTGDKLDLDFVLDRSLLG